MTPDARGSRAGAAASNGSSHRRGAADAERPARGEPLPLYRRENERAWDHWASVESISSRPVGQLSIPEARTMLDPDGWLPWAEIGTVLCLGAGGGQQAPAFAMLGCEVTVVDLSERQLALDRRVAEECGLSIRCIQGDMSDLTRLHGTGFDLVYQPISSCYVPDVTAVYREVKRVLRSAGLYRVEHWNPAHMYLWSASQWSPSGYVLPADGTPGDPIDMPVLLDPAGQVLVSARTFPHSLASLIGSLADLGFAVRRLAEDRGGDVSFPVGSEQRLAAFIPPFLRLLARKLPGRAQTGAARTARRTDGPPQRPPRG